MNNALTTIRPGLLGRNVIDDVFDSFFVDFPRHLKQTTQGYPVGSTNSIRNSLLQYQQLLLQQARKDLRARFPEPVSFNSITYPSV